MDPALPGWLEDVCFYLPVDWFCWTPLSATALLLKIFYIIMRLDWESLINVVHVRPTV